MKISLARQDIMLQMGFSQDEIQDSLVNQKYNDVMATYLLLDYRNSEVRTSTTVCFFFSPCDTLRRSFNISINLLFISWRRVVSRPGPEVM